MWRKKKRVGGREGRRRKPSPWCILKPKTFVHIVERLAAVEDDLEKGTKKQKHHSGTRDTEPCHTAQTPELGNQNHEDNRGKKKIASSLGNGPTWLTFNVLHTLLRKG